MRRIRVHSCSFVVSISVITGFRFIRLTRRQKLVVLDPDRFVRTGRHDLIRGKTFGRWQIAWWMDEPVNEIHIPSIRKLGR